MKIMLVCSTNFYSKVDEILPKLTSLGHTVITPNSYDSTEQEPDFDEMTYEEYTNFFQSMFHKSREKIGKVDAILVLNYTKEKHGKKLGNYIGASTFLEMYEALMQNKKIYMMNNYPDNMLLDEIKGMNPIIINGDLTKI